MGACRASREEVTVTVTHAAATRSRICFFFFQAEDGIRDSSVTGVQTCALPIYRAAKRADHAGGQRALKAERIADGEHFLADLQRGGIAERERHEMLALRLDFHQCDVIALIGANEFCGIARLIAKDDFD